MAAARGSECRPFAPKPCPLSWSQRLCWKSHASDFLSFSLTFKLISLFPSDLICTTLLLFAFCCKLSVTLQLIFKPFCPWLTDSNFVMTSLLSGWTCPHIQESKHTFVSQQQLITESTQLKTVIASALNLCCQGCPMTSLLSGCAAQSCVCVGALHFCVSSYI